MFDKTLLDHFLNMGLGEGGLQVAQQPFPKYGVGWCGLQVPQ